MSWRAAWPALAIAMMACVVITAPPPADPAFDTPRSGFEFLTPDLQALQTDDFANPGFLWVDQGSALWQAAPTSGGQSCAQCHGDAEQSMVGVAARYPAFNAEAGHVINLEQQINQCRRERQGEGELAYESSDLLALTAFVSRQSRGLPVEVDVTGPAEQSYRRGESYFYTRRGQLDLACSSCHADNVDRRLRGEAISQGQINGFPIYRQMWQEMASTHRMFAWCNDAVRAEPQAAGSQTYVDLELFLKARGKGLKVETPAIRK